jgi:hypothetical protein
MAAPTFTVEIGWTSSLASKIVFGQSYWALNTGAATFSVSNIARTSNVATITTSSAHGYSTGNVVNVSGITADTTFNAGYVSITVTTTTAFTFANTGSNVSSTGVSAGSVTLTSNVTATGLLSNTFSQAYSGPYDDVTAYVESVHIKRGRDDLLTYMQASTCDLVLCNPTDQLYFNPAAAGAATTGPNTQTPGIVPMRPVRISATPTNGTKKAIWQGFIRDASYQVDGVVGKLSLTCIDLMMWLARVKPQDVSTISGYVVTNKALTSNVATLTTATAHPFAIGDVVLVAGVDSTFNGSVKITAVTATTISYAVTAANVASVSSSGTIAGQQADTSGSTTATTVNVSNIGARGVYGNSVSSLGNWVAS